VPPRVALLPLPLPTVPESADTLFPTTDACIYITLLIPVMRFAILMPNAAWNRAAEHDTAARYAVLACVFRGVADGCSLFVRLRSLFVPAFQFGFTLRTAFIYRWTTFPLFCGLFRSVCYVTAFGSTPTNYVRWLGWILIVGWFVRCCCLPLLLRCARCCYPLLPLRWCSPRYGTALRSLRICGEFCSSPAIDYPRLPVTFAVRCRCYVYRRPRYRNPPTIDFTFHLFLICTLPLPLRLRLLRLPLLICC